MALARLEGIGRDPRIRRVVVIGAWALSAVLTWMSAHYPNPFIDGLIYWHAWQGRLYAGDFIYPPPGALLFLPAAVLPPGAFLALYLVPSVAAAVWLVWPVRLALRIPLMVLLLNALFSGQIAVLLAVALVFVPRYPVLWTFLAFTKVAPAFAMVSLAGQRRWRDLLLVFILCAVIALSTIIVAPDLVHEWVAKVMGSGGLAVIRIGSAAIYPPMWLRLVLGVAIAYFGANRPWTIAVAAALMTPDLTNATWPLLAAAPRLAGDQTFVTRMNAGARTLLPSAPAETVAVPLPVVSRNALME